MNARTDNELPHEALNDAVAEAIKAATQGVGKVNVLIAGKTGVGKSTLINTVFRGQLAETGSGRPVTQTMSEITKPGHPLTILDTKGLEVADYKATRAALDELIRERSSEEDQDRHIHVAWICISASSKRVEDAEIDLCKMLVEHKIPVVVVLTKARKGDPFIDQTRALIPQAKGVVPVRAISEWIEELEGELPVMGLDALIEITSELIPDAQQRAYASALSTRNKKALDIKKRQAENEVNIAATAAAAAAAIPVPFSDAFTLVPIQIGMIAKIGMTFGMQLSTATVTTLVTSTLGASAATMIGRSVVSGLLKLVPGANVAGAVIASTTAAALTRALGTAYIAVLHDFCSTRPGQELDIEMIAKALKERVQF
ncbi:YcjF family protein [Paraburkholderia dipogonis]|uniref:YcjF family protein n=1 Tax=Paraburkholderia dipogonis TaxID=1211383 RepID=UPI0038BE0942